MAEQITWAGRTLHGTDRHGKWVTLRDQFEGWRDSPEIKGESENRPNADGEYDLPIYNQARLVTIGGHLHTSGYRQMDEAMNFFTGPMSGRLTVAGHGVVQWADMKRNSGVKFTPVTDTFAQWQVRLKAADPRKFGNTASFALPAGATVSVFHRGNYPATPRITVSGSMPGYTLTVNGANYVVTVPLVTGTPHVVDYNDGRLRINGAVVQNSIGNTNLATVPPGQAVAVGLFATSGGTGSAVMALPDTYI